MFRLVFSVPMLLSFAIIIYFPLVILGWILIPIAAVCKAYESYIGHDGAGQPRVQHRFTWKFMWLWDNQIDGISNNSYSHYENMFMRIISWSANRNAVSNLRFVPYLSFKIIPEKIKFIGSFGSKNGKLYDMKTPQWFFCWHGIYSCWYLRTKKSEYLFGWKVYPKDVSGLNKTHYRYESTGFGIQ